MPLPSTILYPSASGGSGGAGDVVGPASSTDNAIARYDGTTGKLLQDSSVLVPDGLSGTVVIGSTGATDLAVIIANGTGGSTVQASAVTCTVAGTCTIPSAGQLKWSTDAGLKRLSAGNIAATDGSTGYGALAAIYIQASSDGLTTSKAGLFTATSPVTFAGLGLASGSVINWSSGANSPWQTIDSGFARDAPAAVRVTNGSTGIGSLLAARSVEANTAGSGTPNALTATESWKVLTNEGATAKNYHTLPTAVAGYVFTFVVQDADGLRVTANSGDTIRVIDKVTAAAGYIESTTIGSVVTLIAINATEWFATSIHGVWTDGTFTYDDTSLTSP